MKKAFDNDAWEEYLYWQSHDKKILEKINALVKDIERNGALKGLGKPEALKGDLSGMYSRASMTNTALCIASKRTLLSFWHAKRITRINK